MASARLISTTDDPTATVGVEVDGRRSRATGKSMVASGEHFKSVAPPVRPCCRRNLRVKRRWCRDFEHESTGETPALRQTGGRG